MKSAELELVKPDPRLHPIARAPEAGAAATIDMVSRPAGLETIVVPIDFSATSEKAIIYAVAFARQFGAQITLLHVLDFLPGIVVKWEHSFEPDLAGIRADAKSRLNMIAVTKVPAAFRAPVQVGLGTAWNVIGVAAHELAADLIILTTHSLTDVGHLLLGSTAERVVRHAPCPVLVVRERECEFVSTGKTARSAAGANFLQEAKPEIPERNHAMTTTSDQLPAPAWEEAAPDRQRTAATGETIELVPQILHLKNILVPIDFSVTAEKALAYAMPFAEQFGAKLTLVHIMELPMRPLEYGLSELNSAENSRAIQQKLDAVRRERIPATLPEPATTEVRTGIPWLEICNLAKEIEADLIILTTHGYTGLKRVFLGSTAERVMRHAPCPVLVVRGKEHEFVPSAAEK